MSHGCMIMGQGLIMSFLDLNRDTGITGYFHMHGGNVRIV